VTGVASATAGRASGSAGSGNIFGFGAPGGGGGRPAGQAGAGGGAPAGGAPAGVRHCRFHPTCSDYAAQALRVHGPIRGTGLAVWRLLRCNPWNAGGNDPVPPR